VARVTGDAAKADTIANRMQRTLIEHMAHDPATYRRFGQMIDDTIQTYRDGRMTEADYLQRMRAMLDDVQRGAVQDVPAKLVSYPQAQPYWSQLRELPFSYSVDDSAGMNGDVLAEMAIALEAIIARRKVRDWTRNGDVQNAMRNDLEDYLYGLQDAGNVAVSSGDMDRILSAVIELAKQRDRSA
jgi:type I restriction enzyme R subunit